MIAVQPILDVYSIALSTAMLLGAAALAVTLAHAVGLGPNLLATAGRLCLVALAFAAFALVFHARVGHPVGSAEALAPLAFLNAHRAMAILVVLTAALATAARRAGGR